MFYVTCKHEFCAAHRILGHQGKCKYLHGHNYLIELTLGCEFLAELSMVVDFGFVKDKLFRWVDDEWDHNTILQVDDPLYDAYRDRPDRPIIGRMPWILHKPPTAEVMAEQLFSRFETILSLDKEDRFVVEEVKLWETSKNCATYRSKR